MPRSIPCRTGYLIPAMTTMILTGQIADSNWPTGHSIGPGVSIGTGIPSPKPATPEDNIIGNLPPGQRSNPQSTRIPMGVPDPLHRLKGHGSIGRQSFYEDQERPKSKIHEVGGRQARLLRPLLRGNYLLTTESEPLTWIYRHNYNLFVHAFPYPLNIWVEDYICSAIHRPSFDS